MLMKNHFCRGVKRGRKYVCGDEASEEERDKAVELLSEAIERIRLWRAWDSWWVEEWMDEWLIARDRLEVQLRGRYSDDAVNAITGLVDRFINYNEQLLNYWREVGYETRRLIDDLMNGRAEVIVRPSGISVHGKHITLKIDRASNDSVTVHLALKRIEGITIRAPNVFRRAMSRKEYEKFVKRVLKALKSGFEETDGFIEKGYAGMGTTQIWQAIVWSILYPGEVYIIVDMINVNESNVTIRWYMKSSHRPLKGKLLNNAEKLSEEKLLAFMFTAVLGDGSADIVKDGHGNDMAISIVISSKKYRVWEPLLERLKKMGFTWHKYPINTAYDVMFRSGYAIDLARAMIGVLPPILRDILDALSFEKWLNLRRIAEMEVKYRRGEMQVDVAGYKFTVDVQERAVVLDLKVKDDAEAGRVIETLKGRYGDGFYAYINKGGKYLHARIPIYVFEKYSDIKEQVIKVLCRKLERTKDERKKREITKQLTRLATPTKGAAAACSVNPQ